MKKSRNEISTFEIKEGDNWKVLRYIFLISILIEILAIPLFLKCEDSTIFLYIVLSSFVVLFSLIKSRHTNLTKVLLTIDKAGMQISDKNGNLKSFPWQVIESIDVRVLPGPDGYWNCNMFLMLESKEELDIIIQPNYAFSVPAHAINRAIISCTNRTDLFHNNIPPLIKILFMSKEAIMSYRGK